MKATELRIGNIVEFMGMEKVIDIEIFKDINSNYATASPIELNEEWLIKFKWQLVKGNCYYINSNFCIDKEGHLYYHSDYAGINIKHIHQLQNLYFALTGKELI